jgi:hypothetical protein
LNNKESGMMKVGLAVMAAIGMVGCATTAKYEAKLQSWVGAPEMRLVRSWGPPQGVYESGGIRFLTWSNSRNVFIPGSSGTTTTQFVGNTAYTRTSGAYASQNIGMVCNTTFEVEGGVITRWRWEGNDCKSK